MKKKQNLAPLRLRLVPTLLAAVPLGLILAGAAAAEGHPEPAARVAGVSAVEPGEESASQRDGRRTVRRFERRSAVQERRTTRGMRREGRSGSVARRFGRHMAERLDLTEEQRDQMREAMREIADNRRDGRRQVADARRSFQRAARDPQRTAEEVQALGEALGRAQAELALQRRTERERMAGILTEEQLQQLEQMRDRLSQRSRRGRRG